MHRLILNILKRKQKLQRKTQIIKILYLIYYKKKKKEKIQIIALSIYFAVV